MSIPLLLGLVILAVYANSFRAPLVLDSKALILNDARLRSLDRAHLERIWCEDYAAPQVLGIYRPLTTLSFALNYNLPGGDRSPVGYHVVNVLLHWFNAVLAFVLLCRHLPERRWAAAAAVIFAVHPIATDAVTNVIGRADVLATTFLLGGLLLHRLEWQQRGWRTVPVALGVALCGSCATLAKETGSLLPALLALQAWALSGWQFPRRVPRGTAGVAVTVVAIAGIWVWRGHLYRGVPLPPPSFFDNPLVATQGIDGLLTALAIQGRYLALLLFPRALSPDYSFSQLPMAAFPGTGSADLQALAVILLAISLGILAVRKRTAWPAFAFGLAWLVGTLFPTSNLLVRRAAIMALRFAYLPMLGFAAAWAATMAVLCGPEASRLRTRILMALAIIWITALGVRTHVRHRDWRDEPTLFRAAVEAAPRSFRNHMAYAGALLTRYRGQPELARHIDTIVRHASIACHLVAAAPPPHWIAEPHLRYAAACITKAETLEHGQAAWFRKAVPHLETVAERLGRHRSQRTAPGQPGGRLMLNSTLERQARLQLASLYEALDEPDRARAMLLATQALLPGDIQLYRRRAALEHRQNRPDAAIAAHIQAILLAPDPRATRDWAALTRAYAEQGTTNAVIHEADGSPRFNLSVPRVGEDIERACAGVLTTLMAGDRREEARRFRTYAVDQLGCVPDRLPSPD